MPNWKKSATHEGQSPIFISEDPSLLTYLSNLVHNPYYSSMSDLIQQVPVIFVNLTKNEFRMPSLNSTSDFKLA